MDTQPVSISSLMMIINETCVCVCVSAQVTSAAAAGIITFSSLRLQADPGMHNITVTVSRANIVDNVIATFEIVLQVQPCPVSRLLAEVECQGLNTSDSSLAPDELSLACINWPRGDVQLRHKLIAHNYKQLLKSVHLRKPYPDPLAVPDFSRASHTTFASRHAVNAGMATVTCAQPRAAIPQ